MSAEYDKILQATGCDPVSCDCDICKSMCHRTPCLGTPEDIEKIIDAGFGHKIMGTIWGTGKLMGWTKHLITMFQPQMNNTCVFLENNLCTLRGCGLKPTEGKLAHHTRTNEHNMADRSIAWNVAKTWLAPENQETINRVERKLYVNA